MADIDVTELLLDPDFADLLVITRYALAIGDNGRQTLTPTTVSPAPPGVIIPQSDLPTQRGPDQQNLPRLISVHTMFQLRPVGATFKADQITFMGDQYIVNKVYPFSRFGAGWVSADCSSIDSTDQAPST